jgi:hypothetical protein
MTILCVDDKVLTSPEPLETLRNLFPQYLLGMTDEQNCRLKLSIGIEYRPAIGIQF